MERVTHMVCPACAQMHGREHREGCPFDGLPAGFRPYPGEVEKYREALTASLKRS